LASPIKPSERVLITGLSGFTGFYLSASLHADGYSICESDRDGAPDYDLTDPASMESLLARTRPDVIFHLAAKSFVADGCAVAFYAVNTVGTTNLFQAVYSSGHLPRRLVVASSANVYGNTTADPIVESTPPEPVNDYACSKLAMEHMVRTWMDRLPIIIARPFNYTGTGQSEQFLVPKLVDHFARKAEVIRLGNQDVVRDFSDVRRTVAAYCRLMQSGEPGETYNICSGQGLSLRWLFEQLTDISGFRPSIEIDQSLVRKTEVKRLVGSNSKLENAVGRLPYSEFRETLRWMYEERVKQLGPLTFGSASKQ
jgi:nucleoside-diphosphate-sugar epimerase